jgi:hypothetical protein
LEVDAGGAEVGVPELALNDVERHALAGELERVRVAQLVWREPPADARPGRDAAELALLCGGRPRVSPRAPVDDAEQRAHGQLDARVEPGAQLFPGLKQKSRAI